MCFNKMEMRFLTKWRGGGMFSVEMEAEMEAERLCLQIPISINEL